MPLTLVPDSDFYPCVTEKISEPYAPRHYFAIVWFIQPKTAVPGEERDGAPGVRLVSPAPDGSANLPALPAYIYVNRICRPLTLPDGK